jgi:L-aspartate semialdehyde sulfurtransferase ferredoxin
MKKSYKLAFPRHLVREPVIFTMAKNYDIMPNIRRARVTETGGEIVLEIEGTEDNIKKAVHAMRSQGIEVDSLESADDA